MKKTEPILEENKDRFVLFPIKQNEMWELYKKLANNFWSADKANFKQDIVDYKLLTDQEKEFIRFVITTLQLRFNYDMNKLLMKFLHEVQYPEARCFYGFQVMMTSIHSETYSLLSSTYIGKSAHLGTILNKVLESDAFKNKTVWLNKNFFEETSFSKRLVAYICIQRILYSSLFAGIMIFEGKDAKLKTGADSEPKQEAKEDSKKKPLADATLQVENNAQTKADEKADKKDIKKEEERKIMEVFRMLTDFIYTDEGLFTDFALTIYSQLENKLTVDELKNIITEVVELEKNLMVLFQPYYTAIGIKTERLTGYSQYIADTIMQSLSGKFIYGELSNPINQLKWNRSFIKIDSSKKPEEGKENSKVIGFNADF